MCSRYSRCCRPNAQPPPRARSTGSMPKKAAVDAQATLNEHTNCAIELKKPPGILADLNEMSRRKRVQELLKHDEFSSHLEEICQIRQENVNHEQSMVRSQVALSGLQTIGSVGTVMPIADLGSSKKYGVEEKIARNKLACLYRLADLFRWSQGIYNHITYRVSKSARDEDAEILINPFGLLYSEITASSLLKIALDGRVLDSGSTNLGVNQAGYVLHSAIHAHRPDIRCVLHLHTPAVTAVSSMKCGLLPISQEAMIVGQVAYHDYQGIVSDENERNSIVMLLRNHGFVACGETLEETLHLAFHLIIACETQLRLGNINVDQIVLPSNEALSKAFATAQSGGGGVNKSDRSASTWTIGELEWEAWMRVLDSAGFYTGHVYKNQSLKFRYKQSLNTSIKLLDIATPPAAQGIGRQLATYSVDTMSRCAEMRKKLDKASWLKGDVDDSKKDSSMRPSRSTDFHSAQNGVDEFKEKQRQMKANRQLGQTTAGPTSQHLSEALQKCDPQTAKQNENSPPYVIQTSSKAIIDKQYRNDAQVCYQLYTVNPFVLEQNQDVQSYVTAVQPKQPAKSTENRLSPTVQERTSPRIQPVDHEANIKANKMDEAGGHVLVEDDLKTPTRRRRLRSMFSFGKKRN
ncbi:Aldolase-II domain-containing protein [Aphelenchoides fujianensis]|nr:Aldolase-II domain-containing protein [Aphelenchoides fujianensis]